MTTPSTAEVRPLLGYHVLEKCPYEPLDLSSVPQVGCLHDYLFAANGVFRRAERREFFSIVLHSRFTSSIPGLDPLQPEFRMRVPKVPGRLIGTIIELAQAPQPFRETLYWLTWKPSPEFGQWDLYVPPQESSAGEVKPIETEATLERFQGVSIEIHTHPPDCPNFSSQDNDQAKGLRVYGLLRLEPEPHLRFRVGMDKLFLEIDPQAVIAHW